MRNEPTVGQARAHRRPVRAPPPFASRARTRVPPAGGAPPGPIYEVRCRPTTADRSSSGHSLRLAERSPQGPTSGPGGPMALVGSVRAWHSSPGRSPVPPSLPPREVLGTVTSSRLPPRRSDPPFGLITSSWASPLRPAAGTADPHDHQRTAGGPLAAPPPQSGLGGPPSTPTRSGKRREPDQVGRERIRGVSREIEMIRCAMIGTMIGTR